MFMCAVGHTTGPRQKAILIPHAIRVRTYQTHNRELLTREGYETVVETPYCEKHAGAAEHNYRTMVKSVMEVKKER